MHRLECEYLNIWANSKKRKPLIIRGARQVGKTTLVEIFAKNNNFKLITINFEVTPELKSFFSNNIKETLNLLEMQLNVQFIPGKTLLFLDEIQQAPSIIANLRYFYENIPALHVIAAGSLLEFELKKFKYSMPIGRVEYLYLGPLSFNNFLDVQGEHKLLEFIQNYHIGKIIPKTLHEKLLNLTKIFTITGGMPESISNYLEDPTFKESEKVKHLILNTYKDDFNKYTTANIDILRKTFNVVPGIIGEKVKYSKIDKNERAKNIFNAIEKLMLARIIYKIHHSSCNGIPLSAEINEKIFKILHLDVGLIATALGLNYLDLKNIDDFKFINSGSIIEQFIGQHLLYSKEKYIEPMLHYWCRENKSSNSEIDYVISHNQKIIPIEVKAGKTGSLRSLHYFVNEKKVNFAVRFNADVPSITDVDVSTIKGKARFKLLSLPIYLVEELHQIVEGITVI